MANEPLMLARQQPLTDAPDAGEYEAFHEVLSASARGRAFLAEHIRRNRGNDTGLLLAAIGRLEALIRAKSAPAPEPPRAEIAGLLAAIRSARPELEASLPSERATRLTAPLDLLEERLAVMASPDPSPEQAQLSLVPPPEEPERPLPPSATAPPAEAPPPLTEAPAPTPPANIPEVVWYKGGPPGPDHFEDEIVWERAMATTVAETIAALSDPPPAPPSIDGDNPRENFEANRQSSDPLAALMALSEEERIALFT
jgi:hypothetical protein